ncbi:glycosyltransferase family 4 protein [Pedobacter sp. SD-b]|uniref:Glycosyltransferase family 4 protein n=1 Tax=Pedobacter segetis TaxID=2793069 RepID=A0ABS1BN89_9SPHI|nr:glycosyltransferase family 1 protein [Pedobacter segetis]MBK0383664.1 glycosyltransferase family 4 protein [Pedobacter segetis]
MPKIFFDHQKFTTQKFGGISRYFANIIHTIKQEPDFGYSLGVANSNNYYIKEEKQFLNNAFADFLLQSEYGFRKFKLNELYCKYLLKQNNFDVFHPTYYEPYFIKDLKKPMVTTIHDMTHERLPQYFWVKDPLTQYKRINANRADKIIAISNTTKNDLLTYLPVDESKIEVIYHGIDLETPLVFEEIIGLPKNYLLFIGDRGGYKNFYLLLDAFAEISKKNPDIELVLAGGGNLEGVDIETINRLKLNDRVKHFNVSDGQLNYLYQNALIFIYPSLYEGFGLPILEAFKAKCPVLLSQTDCFEEIAQNSTAFFSPYSLDDLIFQIDKLINDSKLREELVKKGEKRLADFPLQKSMDKTLALYKTLA